MSLEYQFYWQLAKSIQAWLWVETEIYFIYAAIMDGANPHLVSVTFHNIQSFETKLGLIDSCFALIFTKDSNEWKRWRSLRKKAKKLNIMRNKIVHQPVHVGVSNGVESIEISPSYFNSQALAKGQTSCQGSVIGPDYKPSSAKITENNRIDDLKLCQIEVDFKFFAEELRSYKEDIRAALQSAHESAKKTDETEAGS